MQVNNSRSSHFSLLSQGSDSNSFKVLNIETDLYTTLFFSGILELLFSPKSSIRLTSGKTEPDALMTDLNEWKKKTWSQTWKKMSQYHHLAFPRYLGPAKDLFNRQKNVLPSSFHTPPYTHDLGHRSAS